MQGRLKSTLDPRHLHRAPRGSGLDIRQARFLDASIRIIPITRIFRKGRAPQILLSGSE